MTVIAAGRLIAIARRTAPRAPMETLEAGAISLERGLEGDHKGPKFPNRAITILAREDWDAAVADLTDLAGPVPLAWTVRRANLLVEGIRLPRSRGSILRVGDVELMVTAETSPCRRMEEAHRGLLKALSPDWRGGVTCRVVTAGAVAVGQDVADLEGGRGKKSPRDAPVICFMQTGRKPLQSTVYE